MSRGLSIMPLARVPAWESQMLMYTLAVVLASELRTMRGSAASVLEVFGKGGSCDSSFHLGDGGFNLVDKV